MPVKSGTTRTLKKQGSALNGPPLDETKSGQTAGMGQSVRHRMPGTVFRRLNRAAGLE